MPRFASAPRSAGLYLVALPFLLPAEAALAAALRVPSEYATINAALDASVAGDSVLVAPGIYTVPETRSFGGGFVATCMVFLKDGVSVIGEAGSDATVLDPSGSPTVGGGWVVLGFSMPSSTTLIQGFTVTGAPYGYGGLLVEDSGKVTIRDCHFRDLDAGPNDGGGCALTFAAVDLYSCRFTNCRARAGSALEMTFYDVVMEDCVVERCVGEAGAVDMFGSTFYPGRSYRIERCVFRDNVGTAGSAAVQKRGLGGYSRNVILDCVFEGNQGGSAGAVAGGEFEFRLEGNLFVGNSVGLDGGGGAASLGGYFMVISNNTFVGNVQSFFSAGSALLLTGSVYLTQNVFAENGPVAAVGTGGGSLFIFENGCNVYWDNPGGNTRGVPMGATDREIDPMFCHPEMGDYTVSATSPCAPANSLGCELIGALGIGCGTVRVEATSWARLKSLYR